MDSTPSVLPGRRPPNFKVVGWVLILCGLFLTGFMGWITHYMIGVVNAPTAPGSYPRWRGSHETTVRMFYLFGAVILFGVASLINGVWCVRYRAFQPVWRVLMLLIAAGMIVAGVLLFQTFPPTP